MFEICEETKELKRKFASRNIQGLALDIDETLSFTNEVYFKILVEKFGDPENIGFDGMYKKYKSTHNVPFWQTEEVKTYLKTLRRDSKLQSSIGPIQGAQEAIEEIAKHIHCACYITARPESVRDTTLTWLKKHGFPEAPLIMRPEDTDDEHLTIWKGHVLEYLYPYVKGIIDDNADFAKTLSPDYKGVLFLYDTDIQPELSIQTYLCPTWHEVIENVKTYAKEN